MSSETPSSNGVSLTRLRRTLTLPLSRMKSRGRNYNTAESHSEADCQNGSKGDDGDEISIDKHEPQRLLFSGAKIMARKKSDIRVSRINEENFARNFKASDDMAASGCQLNMIAHAPTDGLQMDANGRGDNVSPNSEQGKKARRKARRYRRWPTQTLARVFDAGLLKRIGSLRKNEHAASVLRTVTIHRHVGDVLGICIKEVKGNGKSNNSVIISRLVPGSVAEKQGQLKRGDEVYLINNKNISHLSLREVAALMDYQCQLEISVRSKHMSTNNNNNNCSKANVRNESTEDHHARPVIASAEDSEPAVSRAPTLSVSSCTSANNASREEIIPSVYDNNFLLDSLSTTSPDHKVEKEYDEAFQILLNAIHSIEKPSKLTSAAPTEGFSYWKPLNQIISDSERIVDIDRDHENVFLSSNCDKTGMPATPQFPSVSELSSSDGPDYDEVYSPDMESTFDDEVQVDGCARLFSPYRRSHSVSCDTTEKSHTSFDFQSLASSSAMRSNPVNGSNEFKSTEWYRTPDGHNNVMEACNPRKIPPTPKPAQVLSSDQATHNPNKSHKNSNLHGVTVGQCREWSGKDIPDDLRKRANMGRAFDGGSHTQDTPVDYQNKLGNGAYSSSDDHSGDTSPELMPGGDAATFTPATHPPLENRTNLELHSPVERSPRSLFKVSQESEISEMPSQEINHGTQSVKHLWSRVTSPPSLRKSKISRRLNKLTKKKPGSPDWESKDSSLSSSVVNRYNLEPGEVQNHRLSCQFMTRNRRHHPSVKPLNISDFRKYKPPSPNADGKYSQVPIEGSLVITLYGARYIKKTVSEVYCISQVDDDVKHRIRTRMQHCRGSVAWNECYEAKLQDAYDLHITLYTWESAGRHKELAKSTLPVSDLLCGIQGVSVKLAVKLEPRGTLYIKLSIEDPSTLQGPKVFGADLQSILDREQSSLHIPLIVRDCIREVELRGMPVIGIYRLCGSAIVKKELRKKYENDSTSVDLSQENYPDVNVITGILKDFLRELPQPLLPPELLEAVTTKMENYAASTRLTSVSSAFDPTPIVDFPGELAKATDLCTGRQSVILDLIEVEKKVTLPPAEKATLYALLNHLKRVSANQTQNKMSCQNLAVCFGPVLLGSINMSPPKGTDLAAAIGFKQHIQVLNFMVSNWPNEPVLLDSPENVLLSPESITEPLGNDNRRASKRISRVSLTRRISHIFPSYDSVASLDSEARNCDLGRMRLSGSRKSGSLTNILESNLNDGEDYLEDCYFDCTESNLYYHSDNESIDDKRDMFNANAIAQIKSPVFS